MERGRCSGGDHILSAGQVCLAAPQVDLASVSGSGPAGRITAADVEAAAGGSRAPAAPGTLLCLCTLRLFVYREGNGVLPAQALRFQGQGATMACLFLHAHVLRMLRLSAQGRWGSM